MKKFIGKSAAIAAAALLFAQSMPMIGIQATDADKNKLTIHPYLVDADTYSNRESDVANKATGLEADSAKVSGMTESDVKFSVKRVNEDGTVFTGDGAFSSSSEGKTFDNLPDGYYLIDPVDSTGIYTTDSSFSAADAFIIQLPVPKEEGGNIRDVHIYPKLVNNDEKDDDKPTTNPGDSSVITDGHCVILTKYQQDGETPLPGAEYVVYYKDAAGNWKAAGGDGALENAKKYTTGEGGKLTITGLPLGDYYFVEQSAPEGYLLDQTPVKFSIDGKAPATAQATNDAKLTVTEGVANDATGDKSYNWKIKADVPSKTDNLTSYVITDEFTNLDSEHIVVKIGGVEINADNTDYTVAISDDDKDGTGTITITVNDPSKLVGGTPLDIIIESQLKNINDDATNKASIDYGYAYNPDDTNPMPDIPDIKDPDKESSYPIIEKAESGDPTNLTLGTFKISNVAQGDASELLNAEYKIEGSESFSKNLTDAANGNDKGFSSIVNFAPGKYIVTQTKAGTDDNNGKYLVNDTPKTIFITAGGKMYEDTTGDGKLTLDGELKDKEITTDGLVFINQKTNDNFALPFTGTTATRVFTITGICVMLAAGIFIFILLKKKDEDEEENKG